MEEFIFTWDCFVGSREVWFFQPFNKDRLRDRILGKKLEKLDTKKISEEFARLRWTMQQYPVSDEQVEVYSEEYDSISKGVEEIFREVSAQIDKESEEYLLN
jgi:hypothetical protein